MQSLLLARELASREMNVEILLSGSLRRQLDTAEPTAALLEREVLVDARWNEYDMDDILAHHSNSEARANQDPDAKLISPGEFQTLLEDALAGWIEAEPEAPAEEEEVTDGDANA